MNSEFDPVDSKLIEEYNSTRPLDRQDNLCHAPFKSLLFIPSGHAMACHHNRGITLGKYPEDSIREIWFGNKLNKLRKYISNNDLSFGCQNCRDNINNRNFHLSGAWKHDYMPDKENDYPVLLDFQIENTCNLECIMCSGEYSSLIRKNREKAILYNNPFDTKFIEQLEEFIPYLQGANFTGGEPFLIKTYYGIWEKMLKINPGIQIYVHTNGIVLNEKVKDVLSKLNFNFTISIESLQKEVYESIRVNSNFEKVMQNIRYFYEYTKSKNTSFHIKFCLMRQNYCELPGFMKYFNDQNISVQIKPVWIPSMFSLRSVEAKKLESVIGYLSEFTFAQDTHFQRLNVSRYREVINQLTIWHGKAKERIKDNSIDTEDIDGLKTLFYEHINKQIANDHTIDETERLKKVNTCKSAGEKMISSIEDEEMQKTALKHFIDLPVEMIIAEMERGTNEPLIARFKQEA
ncbi:MAG: radical SAM protein [Bacteroidota bacterium]